MDAPLHPPAIAVHAFEETFGLPAAFHAYAPGRVNLIGEHIDYQGGTVLPIAIERGVHALLAPRPGGERRWRVCSMRGRRAGEVVEAGADLAPPHAKSWAAYPLAVVRAFEAAGHPVPGFDLLYMSDVPSGSGLSSSAAIEVALAAALREWLGLKLDDLALARLAQEAERAYVGVPCGLMDQAASACCSGGHALALSCAAAAPDPPFRQVPVPAAAAFIVAHCGVPRRLHGSAYAERQEECQRALLSLSKQTGRTYEDLCAVPLDLFEAWSAATTEPEMVQRRARFAVEEQARVAAFTAAFETGDLPLAGQIMNAGHAGLRDLYEVSTPELDDLTALARECPGVFGSRLTGAGFGGCAIALVESGTEQAVINHLLDRYYDPRDLRPIIFATRAKDGVHAERILRVAR